MRKPVKPSDKQKEIIQTLKSELDSWTRTNDMDSPTLYSDIYSSLKIFDINDTLRNKITNSMRELLIQIKHIEDN